MLGDNSVLDPPDPMPNSEVKRNSVDDSVGLPCESRTLPSTYLEKARFERVGLFYVCRKVKTQVKGKRHQVKGK